jgi:hypothetical protein
VALPGKLGPGETERLLWMAFNCEEPRSAQYIQVGRSATQSSSVSRSQGSRSLTM